MVIEYLSIGVAIGTFLFGWTLGKRQAKELSKQVTQNVIDILKLNGTIDDINIHLNKQGIPVKPVRAMFTFKYNIEKPIKKSPV